MDETLDRADIRILSVLQEDSSLSTVQVAQRVGLSQSPCWKRIERLRREGYIAREVAVLNARKIGFRFQVFALIKFNSQGRNGIEDLCARLLAFPEITECFVLLGATDFLLKVLVRHLDEYERFVYKKLGALEGVQGVTSMVTLTEVKSTTSIPLETLLARR